MKRIALAIGLIALLITAAPAAAAKPKPLYYDGKTDDGNSISFTVTGKRVSGIGGHMTSVCVPTSGVPRNSASGVAAKSTRTSTSARATTASNSPSEP